MKVSLIMMHNISADRFIGAVSSATLNTLKE